MTHLDTEPLPSDLAKPRKDPEHRGLVAGIVIGGTFLAVDLALIVWAILGLPVV